MIQKTIRDIDREIEALRKRIGVLQNEKFHLHYMKGGYSNAWRDTCNECDNTSRFALIMDEAP